MSSQIASRRKLIVPTVLFLGLGVFAVIKFSRTPEPVRAEGGGTPAAQCARSGITIVSSVPVDGFIDPRADASGAGNPLGILSIDVSFNTQVELTTDCIDILTTATTAPQVLSLTGADYDWTIVLDSPMPGGESTAIAFWGGLVGIIYHSQPANVDLNGVSDEDDLTALEAAVQAGSADLDRYDIDRDGDVDSADVDRLEGLLASGYGGVDWEAYGREDNRFVCCCNLGACNLRFAQFCPNGTEVTCPCWSSLCGGNGSQ